MKNRFMIHSLRALALASSAVAYANTDAVVLKVAQNMQGRSYVSSENPTCYQQASVQFNPTRITLKTVSSAEARCEEEGQLMTFLCTRKNRQVFCDTIRDQNYHVIYLDHKGESFRYEVQSNIGQVTKQIEYYNEDIPSQVEDYGLLYKNAIVLFKDTSGDLFPAVTMRMYSNGQGYFAGFGAGNNGIFFNPPGHQFAYPMSAISASSIAIPTDENQGWTRKHGLKIARPNGVCYGRIHSFFQDYVLINTINAGNCGENSYFIKRYEELETW